MAGNAKFALKVGGVAIVVGVIVDNWSGSNAILGTGLTGTSGLVSTLRGGSIAGQTAAKPVAGA